MESKMPLKQLMDVAERHAHWWLRRYPWLASYRDDVLQESMLAAWISAKSHRVELSSFYTYAFRKMFAAVRAALRRSGFARRQLTSVSAHAVQLDVETLLSSLEADRPTLLREALALAESPFHARGASPRAARVLALLSVGETLENAGLIGGVTKQRAHQLAQRWRVQNAGLL